MVRRVGKRKAVAAGLRARGGAVEYALQHWGVLQRSAGGMLRRFAVVICDAMWVVGCG